MASNQYSLLHKPLRQVQTKTVVFKIKNTKTLSLCVSLSFFIFFSVFFSVSILSLFSPFLLSLFLCIPFLLSSISQKKIRAKNLNINSIKLSAKNTISDQSLKKNSHLQTSCVFKRFWRYSISPKTLTWERNKNSVTFISFKHYIGFFQKMWIEFGG